MNNPVTFFSDQTGKKFEDALCKYQKSSSKLHRIHNEYVAAVQEANLHQKALLSTTLPCLLSYQQEVQESLVTQW